MIESVDVLAVAERVPLAKRCALSRPKHWLALAAVLLLGILAAPVFAQSLADGFNPNANGTVWTLAVQADGKALVGGAFTQIGGQTRNHMARLNADGTLDAGFNPGANGDVYSLAVQTDGKVLVGGWFTQVGGQARNRLARLNADGTLDASFDVGIDPFASEPVRSIVVQPDGKVLVGGAFSSVGGPTRNGLVRLNADGTLDAGFDPAAINGVSSLALQADGKVVIGGLFTQIGAQARNRLARLNADGTLDAGFDPGANSTVLSLALQPDGKLLVGGFFTQIGGQARNFIARVDANGALDAGFTPGANNSVWSLVVQPDGKLLVGGDFTQIGVHSRSRIARLSANGTLDAGFNPGANDRVLSLAMQADGNVLVGGQFSQVGGQTRNFIARLNVDSTLDADFNPGADSSVLTLAVQPDGRVLVGGEFTQIGGQARDRIARLNADGTLDAGFNPGANSYVYSLAVQPDGKVLVGGNFTQIGGQLRNRIARLNADGTLDAGFNPGASGSVYSLVVQPDGKVLVGGLFTQIGGQPRNRISRLNADGTLDAGFNPGANEIVRSLAVLPDGKVLVSGFFSQIGGQARNRIARLNADGTLDTGFNPGANSYVHSLAVQPDGKVLVGGAFTQIGGQTRNYIARLHADGTLDAGFNPGANGYVFGLAVQPDGKLLLGGQFSQVGGQTRNYIARLNVDGTVDADFNPGGNGTVYSLAVQPDGKVLVGGLFTQVGGQARNRIARLRVPEAALQTLEVGADRASVQWRRSGSGPELYRVWFERSDNGSAWTALGEATRITGGWSLDGLTLPRNQNLWLRARGMANNGYSAASVSLIESVRLVYMAETHVVTATVQSGQGGVTPLTQSVEPGQEAQFSVTPDPGWHVASVTGDTCTPTDQGGGGWRAPNIQASCAVVVTFEQNPPPVATAQDVDVPFNTAKAITLGGNDPNLGGPFTFTYTLTTQPTHGTISGFDPNTGTLTYAPTLGYSGADSFTFTAQTVNGTSAPATLSLTIEDGQPVVATPQSVSLPFNTAQPITLVGSDPNPGGPFPFTYTLATQPTHGTISGFDPNTGTLTYMPTLGYPGADSFTFTANTVNGTSAPATVSLTIEYGQAVVATPQSVTVAFNTAQAITLAGNDDNPGGPHALTFTLVDAPTHGTIDNFDADAGTLTYMPTLGYSGADAFTFTLATINGTSAAATVTLTIEDGEPVVAAPQSVTVSFNTAQVIALSGSDDNPGGPHALTFELVDGPSNGAISGFDAAAGTLIYTPSLGYSGTDALTFTIATINGTSGLALVRLTVEDGQAVVANPQNVNVGFNTTQTITLVGTDANPGGPHALTFALLDAPTHGTIHAFDGAAGTLTYTPAPAYFGADAFTFTVTTINGISLPATVSVTVVAPQLALSIDDSRDYARYGQMVDYVITLTNTGDTANAVPVEFSLSSGFDGDYARLTCIGADGGTLCAQDSGNPLRFMVTLPAARTLNWLVSVPVRVDAEATRVEISVSATGATPVIDANTLVLYRDGFDAPYGDGTHSAAVILGAQAREILTSDTLHELTLPAALPATPKALLIVRDADQALRVEACRVGNLVWVRLLQRDVHGYEHATAWTEAPIGAVLVLGSVATDDESRTIVLLGADSPVVLQ